MTRLGYRKLSILIAYRAAGWTALQHGPSLRTIRELQLAGYLDRFNNDDRRLEDALLTLTARGREALGMEGA